MDGVFYLSGKPMVFPVLFTVFAFTFAFLARRLVTRSIEKTVRKLYGEGANKGVLGPHELELVENSLIERTDAGATITALHAIEKIVSTDDYTFIYINVMAAHAVPRRCLNEVDYQAFVDSVNREWRKALPA